RPSEAKHAPDHPTRLRLARLSVQARPASAGWEYHCAVVRWRRLIPSIALLVFFVVLWFRSYRVTDYPHADLNIIGTGMYSAAGGARFSVFVFGRDPRWAVRWEVLTPTTYPNYSFSHGRLAKLGFGADTG